MRWMIIILFLFIILVIGIYTAMQRGLVPARWNPLAFPDPAQAPGPLTRWQLRRMAADTPGCFAWLEAAGVSVVRVPDRAGSAPGCGLTDTATLRQSSIRYNTTVTATCPVLAGLVLFERHVVTPAAATHFQAQPTKISHYGTYACRAVRTNRGEGGRRSQHATANAIDIAGVQLDNGRALSLLTDWPAVDAAGAPTPAAQFWRDTRAGACRIFPTVLGPDYNALHRDHFHFDMGGFAICR